MSGMSEQNFAKHAKIDPLFHRTLVPLLLIIFIGAMVNFVQSLGDHSRLYNASLIVALSFALMLCSILIRVYPLKAQDRAIRAEENLRHYVLTGKLLDRRLTVKQIVALRFASDEEFVALAARPLPRVPSPRPLSRRSESGERITTACRNKSASPDSLQYGPA
ncbi:MAG: DUF6526 family protein [Acidobacteriota bacterium]